MSKIDAIEKPRAGIDSFTASFDKLKAVESVVALVGGLAGGNMPAMDIPDQAELEFLYHNQLPMVQHGFNQQCDILAAMAQSGARALMQINSEGRSNSGAAIQRLHREIEIAGKRAIKLLKH